ncbi:unnamed protein product (macronuclear) [Paramecium tetraurelia]|uniref:RAP domain-containing protein n=1 Tax=Paramecium tetraurelia TaxID=5888 RepID=A0DH56_PARTE|nr:uncharacterized protein GSPATT00016759001 [Paramecium tetraurelia]CAK82373.1 unnamed protein product [Paramecium tetraurelia]|eukprot:XP_001449770.1 hypothetical protein (macronuclear) [Paramecium tetraurelia strain d4-2]
MNRIIRFGFATYESLVQKLSSADSPAAVLQIFQQNKDLFKQEHVVLSLRMLGRYSRLLRNDSEYSELTSKLNDIVDQLTEYDVIDVLFWMRKFRQNRIPTYFHQQAQTKLYQRIQQMSENQMFSFRNMCNVYFDLTLLNHSNEQLAQSIAEQILTTKQLSPFLIIQLFSSIVVKVNNCSLSRYDAQILNNAVKVVEDILEELDVEQKSLLFKSLAEVQFQNIGPKYSLPNIIKQLKDLLLQKIELLQEDSVISIFKAYQSLPKYFDQDLHKELKDMIQTTIDQNPNNLSSKFLILLIEKITNSHAQRYPLDLVKKIIGELTQRISKKEVETQHVGQLCSSLLKQKKFEDLVAVLKDSGENNLKILNYLFVNGINMKEYVEQYIQAQDSKRINTYNALHYLIYSHRDAQEHEEKFMAICKSVIQQNPQSLLKTSLEININSQIKAQVQEEAFMQIIQNVKQKKIELSKVLKELLNSCFNHKCRQALIQLNEQSEEKLQPKTVLSKVIGDMSDFDSDRLSIVLQLIQKDPKNIPIFKFVDYLTLNVQNLYGLVRSDQIQWVCQVLLAAFLNQPTARLNALVSFVERFESAGYSSRQLTQLIKKVAEQYRTANPQTPYPDSAFVQIMINQGVMTPEDAVIQLNNEKSYYSLKVQLCGIALQLDNPPENVIQLKDKIKADCQLDSDDMKFKQIQEIVALFRLTPNETDKIKNQLKNIGSKLTQRQYFELVQNAKEPTLIKELAIMFSQIGTKIGLIKLIKIVEKFQKNNVANQMIYNILLEQYGLQFNNTFNELRVQILTILANGKLKQVDVFQKTLEKLSKSPQFYKAYYADILESLIQLGIIEPDIVNLIKTMAERQNLSNQSILKLIHYYILADQPLEEIEKIANNMETFKAKETYRINTIYEILKRMYPDSKATKIHEPLINEEKIQSTSNRSQHTSEYVQTLLQAVGVQAEMNYQIDKVQIELYLPQTQQSIMVLTGYNLNYDKITLTGQGLLQKKLYNLLSKQVITINFKELVDITNYEDKVKYLQNQGIEISADPATADYSAFNQVEKKDSQKRSNQKKQQKQQKQQIDQDEILEYVEGQ